MSLEDIILLAALLFIIYVIYDTYTVKAKPYQPIVNFPRNEGSGETFPYGVCG